MVKVLNPYTHSVHSFLIEFKAPDWRFYSQVLTSHDMGQTFVKGGGAIPMAIPWAIPVSTASVIDKIVTNQGNEATDPIFTITGPGTTFTITNFTTGKTFILSTTLGAGDVVVIDIKNRTVILNGTDNLYPDITGDFWSLIPGENELRFFVTGGLTVDTNLNLSYRDAYNGV